MANKLYDLTKLYNTCFNFPPTNRDNLDVNLTYVDPEPLVNKIIENYQDSNDFDTLLYFKESTHSAFPYLLSKSLNIDLVSLSNKTGLNTNTNMKIDFNKKYCLWMDTLTYNYNTLCSLDKLRKKGITITHVFSFMNMQCCCDLYIKYLYPDIHIYELYKLINVINFYNNNNYIDSYMSETVYFNNDINYKKTKILLSRITSLYEKSAEHFKNRLHYLTHNYNLNIYNKDDEHYDMNNMSLSYMLNYISFDDLCKDINKYGNSLNYIIINRSKVDNIDDNKLLELQKKYNFYVIEHNPERFMVLDAELEDLNNNSTLIKTNYDGLVLFINNDTLLNYNMILNLSRILNNNKVLLYFNIDDNNLNSHELMKFIIDINTVHNKYVLGLILEYKNLKNYRNNLIKRIRLLDLIPVYIYFDNYENDDIKYINNHKFRYCLLNNTMVPYFNDINKTLKDNNNEIVKEINELVNNIKSYDNYFNSILNGENNGEDYNENYDVNGINKETYSMYKTIYNNIHESPKYNLSSSLNIINNTKTTNKKLANKKTDNSSKSNETILDSVNNLDLNNNNTNSDEKNNKDDEHSNVETTKLSRRSIFRRKRNKN